MENRFEVKSRLETDETLTDNRVRALKSLATLLLNELEFLETLTPNRSKGISDGGIFSLASEVEHFEIQLIRNALIQSGGHQLKAAKVLGIKMTTLNMKLKRFQIDARAFISMDKKRKDEKLESISDNA
jgi:transcriptional regulator with GAF, ATPase, and Fis domain